MTFWQDARPASPRLRIPRPPRSSRRWSRRRRRCALLVVAALVGTVGVLMVRAGGEASPRVAAARSVPTASHASRLITSRWSRTLTEQPQTVLAVHDDAAIVISDASVSSIALADGAVRWRTTVPTVQQYGDVRGDTVLLPTRTGFVALDRDSGSIRWQMTTPETPGPVGLVGPVGVPPIAVLSTDQGGLVGLDSRTGVVRWSVRYEGWMRGVPAVDGSSGLLATVWQGREWATRLRLIDGATGRLQWEQPLAVMASAAIIVEDLVVVGAGTGPHDSEVRAFALADGAPKWRSPVDAPFQPASVPLADGDDLYVVDQLGTVTRLDRTTGSRRWATATRALQIWVHPIRVDDAILLWNESHEVVTLDRTTGAIRARRRPAGRPVGVISTRRLVVVVQRFVDRDTIQAFGADQLVAPARSRR